MSCDMCAVVQAPHCREYTTKELIWSNVYPLVQDVVVQSISLIGSGSLKLPHIISSHCPHGTRDASYDLHHMTMTVVSWLPKAMQGPGFADVKVESVVYWTQTKQGHISINLSLHCYAIAHRCSFFCTYVCIYVCRHVCVYVCRHVCVYVCGYVCMYVGPQLA